MHLRTEGDSDLFKRAVQSLRHARDFPNRVV